MKKQEIIAAVEKLLEPIAAELGYEVVDVEYEKEGREWHLRVFADKEGGFSINDCVALSRALESRLEETDPIENAYHLEVSSPGLDRPLKKDKDFVRSIGKLVEIHLYSPMEETGSEREFIAALQGFDPQAHTITVELENGTTVVLNQKDIALVRLAVIF